MAAIAQELADSLTQDEIPIKLRCASCNKLVLNAFRLPCCDQNVCESCQTTLPDTCPVCMHSPLSADDCKPNKALRLTVKAFLKNEEKKRDKVRVDSVPATPTTAAPAPQPDVYAEPDPTIEAVEAPKADNIVDSIETEDLPFSAADASAANGSAETSTLELAEDQADGGDQTPSQPGSPQIITGDEPVDGQVKAQNLPFSAEPDASHQNHDNHMSQNQQPIANGNTRFDMMNNGFNGMNPMMMQNAMAMGGMNGMNGMNNMGMNGWGNFPNMMGMGMDPSMMMFGGFNNQSMGFNGMNMGAMGFDGGFGNWGSQMGGMNGDFGANAGYYPNSGYNQRSHRGGHFNQMSQRNPSHSMHNNRSGNGQTFAQRPYDRSQDEQYRAGVPQQNGDNDVSAKAQNKVQDTTDGADQKMDNQALKPSAADGDASLPSAQTDAVADNDNAENANGGDAHELIPDVQHETLSVGVNGADIDGPVQSNIAGTDNAATPQAQPIGTYDTSESATYLNGDPYSDTMSLQAMAPSSQYMHGGYNEYAARGRGAWRGRGRGRGGFGRGSYMVDNNIALSPGEPSGQGVVGAPTGPKAMRDGGSAPGFRGRGGFVARGGRSSSFVTAASPAPPSAETAPVIPNTTTRDSPVRDEGLRTRSKSRSGSPSHHKSYRRRRSESATREDHYKQEESSDEHRRSKRHRHSRKEDDYDDNGRMEEDSRPTSRHDRSRSRESKHRHSKHRSSRHDKEESRSREESYDRDHDRDRKRDEHRSRKRRHHSRSRSRSRSPRRDDKAERSEHQSRHRSRRERDRDRDVKDRDDRDRKDERDKDYDRERKRSRREYSRERPHSSRNMEKEMLPPPLPQAPSAPSTAPKEPKAPATDVREFKIQGRSRLAQQSTALTATAPNAKPSSTSHPDSSRTKSSSTLETAKAQVRAERGPEVDPHTLEREARNRERMLKEAQRMSLLMHGGASGGGNRKGSDAGKDARRDRNKKRDRRTSSAYEEDDAEARARRVEEEREAERWS